MNCKYIFYIKTDHLILKKIKKKTDYNNCGVLFSSRPKDLVLCSLFKAEGEGSCLRCGTAKKPKATKDQVLWPGAKKHPTLVNRVFIKVKYHN